VGSILTHDAYDDGAMTPYLAVFVSVFLAELGDKTQLATLLFAADPAVRKAYVFVASAGALCLSTALAVLVGGYLGAWLSARLLRTIAGIGFIAIGAWMLLARS
jgi:putative Ca2+/H+ antiporter (TMEM165/GDT1 family)